nr:retrovirus-related Pol polyprotein from transposon TNT 1-94 [Tanacetum cinerariifolium]
MGRTANSWQLDLHSSGSENTLHCFFIIPVQTPGSGISILLAVRTPSTGSRNLYCQYQDTPTKKYLEEIKRVFQHLRGTINIGLWYPKETAMAVTAYADADHTDKMANKNVLAPIKTNKQLVPIKARLPIGKSNLLMDLQKKQKKYYKKYLEMAARKPRQPTTMINEEGGKKKKAPKASKSKQPTPAKHLKPLKKTTSKPTPSKKSHKGKRSNHLVDKADEEPQPASELQVEDDEHNLQRGTQMSLESLKAPIGNVVIYKPDPGASKISRKIKVRGKELFLLFDSTASFSASFRLDVVEDALAQSADRLGLIKNEDHQVLRNKQKLEKDATNCTRVDDDGVKFSPKGGDYFPTMERYTVCEDALDLSLSLAGILKMETILARTLQSINLLTALLFSYDFEMNIHCSSLAHSCERLLLKAKAEFFEQPTMPVAGAGLDELKHDLSDEESMAQKSTSKSSYFVLGANIEPNKAGSDEVADLDPDQLPTLTFVVLVSSVIPISNILYKTFTHMKLHRRTITLDGVGRSISYPASGMLPYPFVDARLGSVSSLMYSITTSTCNASFFRASEFLFWNLHAKVSKEFLFLYLADKALLTSVLDALMFSLMKGPTDGANVEAYLCRPLGLSKRASNVWDNLKGLAGLSHVAGHYIDIFEYLIMFAKRRSCNSVIAKLVLSASAYYL